MLFTLIIGIALGAAAIVFALENATNVALTFLGWQFQGSLAAVILIAVAIGVILGIVTAVPGAIRRGLLVRTLRRQNAALEDEVATLEEREAAARHEADALRNPASPNTVDLREP